jgi:hypothetical protein
MLQFCRFRAILLRQTHRSILRREVASADALQKPQRQTFGH